MHLGIVCVEGKEIKVRVVSRRANTGWDMGPGTGKGSKV